MAFAGNALSPRWGHSATLHDTRVLIYAGRNTDQYYNTIEFIDTSTQLIELKPEELAKEEIRRKRETKNSERELVGNLQRSVQSLQEIISKLGAEVMNNRRILVETANRMNALLANNEELKKQLNMDSTGEHYIPTQTVEPTAPSNPEDLDTPIVSSSTFGSQRDQDY